MNPFTRIQQDAADAIIASPAFADVPVLVDDGRQEQEVTKQLTRSGVCVLVGMPEGFNTTSAAHKTVAGEVSLAVEVITNPEKFKGSIPRLVGELVLAVVSSPVLQARNHFTVDGFDMVANLPGLIGYEVSLKRLTTVSA